MKKKGFTLVELVTVIVVLGIIILIAIPGVNITLRESRKKAFKVTCDKVFALDEKYELYQDLTGTDFECVIFDFDKNEEIPEQGIEIDGEWYEPLSKIGLENEEGLTGQYRVCKDKQMNLSNGEFTCVYDKNNNKVLSTKKGVGAPVLLGATITPDKTKIKVKIQTEEEVEKYFYKLNNGEWIQKQTDTYTFTGLEENTEYTVTIYVENSGLKSEERSYTVTTDDNPLLEDREYEEGEIIYFGDDEYIVVKDNGDNVTLITRYNQKADSYGTTSSWNDSEVKSYLNNDWVSLKQTVQKGIEKGAIIYDNTSSSYVRLITKSELKPAIKNGSNTPFWTMTNDGNDVYYGLKTGAKKYTKYTTTNETTGIYYQGTNATLSEITKEFAKNEVTETNVDAKALSTSTQSQVGDTLDEVSVTGKETYTSSEREVTEDCNCTTEEQGCTNVACNETSYSTQTVSDSYCEGSACAKSGCVTSTCSRSTGTGYWCGGYASISCGKTACGSHPEQYEKCNTYNEGKSDHDVVCGPAYRMVTDSCDSYCQGECTDDRYDGSACAGSACASSGCTKSTCSKYITTSKLENTITNIVTSTCRTCASTSTTCEQCKVNKTIYEASGSNVTYKHYTVSETTDVLGIRAVITVRKRK